MKKTIYLTERDIRQMIKESVQTLLLETDRRVERARKGCARYLKNFGDIKSAFRKFREDFYSEGLMDNNMLWTLQLAPMFCKFAVENGWTPTTGVNTDAITEVKKILFEIVNNHKEDIPELVNNNPNDITWNFIHNEYQQFIDKRQEQENARISQNQYTKDNRYNYKIYGSLTFEQAKEFGDCSYLKSKICYTQSKDTWNSPSYTNNNTRKVYVLVLSNWKDIPCEHTPDGYFTHTTNGDPIPADNNGYDLYGMSMIFLIVDRLGKLVVSNTRWNHGGSGREENIDHMFTKEDIYKLIGSEKADEIFKSEYQNIQDALNKGVSIDVLFDGWQNVGNGYIKVCVGGKWSISDNNKQIIYKPNDPEQWFDWVGEFKNGIARVDLNDKYNWFSLEKQGLLSQNKWFDKVDYFYDGFAKVKLNGQWNWFSLENQEEVSPNQWFDVVEKFENGIAEVKLNRKWTWFSLENQDYLFPNKWFDWVYEFDSNGIAPVELNGQWNWFSLEIQELVSPNQWFDKVEKFENGIARVKLNDKWTWFSFEKQDYLFPNKWFIYVDDFDSNGIAEVKLNGKWYYFTLDGQLLDSSRKRPLSQEEVQELFQQQQQLDEMVNRLVKKYLR